MTRFGSGCSGSGCFAPRRTRKCVSSFIAEELNLVHAKWPGRGFSVPDDGLGLSECDCHHHPLVVRRRLPAPRPDVVFETNLSAVVGALGGCARNSRRRDCFWVAAKSIRRQLIWGALTVVLAVLLHWRS
jgi:hypothetical protein